MNISKDELIARDQTTWNDGYWSGVSTVAGLLMLLGLLYVGWALAVS